MERKIFKFKTANKGSRICIGTGKEKFSVKANDSLVIVTDEKKAEAIRNDPKYGKGIFDYNPEVAKAQAVAAAQKSDEHNKKVAAIIGAINKANTEAKLAKVETMIVAEDSFDDDQRTDLMVALETKRKAIAVSEAG